MTRQPLDFSPNSHHTNSRTEFPRHGRYRRPYNLVFLRLRRDLSTTLMYPRNSSRAIAAVGSAGGICSVGYVDLGSVPPDG
ncbi:hypothetical protein BDZ94DRAFT_892119 [Collybia nuda]|uniref:Uncharacterized protein n=1 Tax=Collybia nuda TaxID=64659 RepID=A0A9P5Y3F9_9AGAR|nr:hypothetical protein BDZ94DRAFT_892119 [Collybia nuda]